MGHTVVVEGVQIFSNSARWDSVCLWLVPLQCIRYFVKYMQTITHIGGPQASNKMLSRQEWEWKKQIMICLVLLPFSLLIMIIEYLYHSKLSVPLSDVLQVMPTWSLPLHFEIHHCGSPFSTTAEKCRFPWYRTP